MRFVFAFVSAVLLLACAGAESVLVVTAITDDVSHVPLPGVTIRATRGPDELVTKTDDYGRARFVLSSGKWNIRAELAGTYPPPSSAVSLRGKKPTAMTIPIRIFPEDAFVVTTTGPPVHRR
jgi:hypothetical protein